MKRFRILILMGALAPALLLARMPVRAQEVRTETDPGVDVQARGPVHEAYAEPTETRPEPGPVVSKQPPDPVDEMPPDQKPEGENVQWIPGHWAFDDEARDYLWVSGFWRDVPPGRQWMPGNWQQVQDGWQWVPGFWATAAQEEVNYLPAPPLSIEEGPSTQAPDDNSVYTPGCWVYQDTRYLWRPGFWMAFRPNWVWIPAHYLWSPAGYVFVDGYWDYPLEQRGLLFAPVRIRSSLLSRRGWSYTPSYVIEPDFLISALFVRPATDQYYFGDYFQPDYRRQGIIPWVDYRLSKIIFDPNLNYYRHRFWSHPNWERNLRQLYVDRREGRISRPPRTLAQQTQLMSRFTNNRTGGANVSRNVAITNLQNVSVLAPLSKVHNTRVTNLASLTGVKNPRITAAPVVRLARVSQAQRVAVRQAAVKLHTVAQQRRQVEAKMIAEGTTAHHGTNRVRPVKINLPKQAISHVNVQSTVRKGPPPALPKTPAHQVKPIPKHQAPLPAQPPRNVKPNQPPRKETPPPRDVKPPPRKETPPPRKETPPPKKINPPPPPRKEVPPPKGATPPPPPPKKEAPPPPPKRTPPPPPPKKDAPPKKDR